MAFTWFQTCWRLRCPAAGLGGCGRTPGAAPGGPLPPPPPAVRPEGGPGPPPPSRPALHVPRPRVALGTELLVGFLSSEPQRQWGREEGDPGGGTPTWMSGCCGTGGRCRWAGGVVRGEGVTPVQGGDVGVQEWEEESGRAQGARRREDGRALAHLERAAPWAPQIRNVFPVLQFKSVKRSGNVSQARGFGDGRMAGLRGEDSRGRRGPSEARGRRGGAR